MCSVSIHKRRRSLDRDSEPRKKKRQKKRQPQPKEKAAALERSARSTGFGSRDGELQDKFKASPGLSSKRQLGHGRKPLDGRDDRGALQDNNRDTNKPLSMSCAQPVLLSDSIPAVLRWVRNTIDLHPGSNKSLYELTLSSEVSQ